MNHNLTVSLGLAVLDLMQGNYTKAGYAIGSALDPYVNDLPNMLVLQIRSIQGDALAQAEEGRTLGVRLQAILIAEGYRDATYTPEDTFRNNP